MTRILHQDQDRVLMRLREMPEVDLHKKIVIPLLGQMGASHIRYTHGAFERGKDIIYLTKDFLGENVLTVCQVKNELLTGNFSRCSSTITVLNQAICCTKVEVLNPSTNQKELPRTTIVISTYALPDSATADAGPLLTEFRTKCSFVGPEKLTELLRSHLPDLFAELAHPGSGAIACVRRYVAQHHEAQVFDLPLGRDISEFFVNLGLTQTTSVLARILSGILKPARTYRIDIPKREYRAILGASDRFNDILRGTKCFDVAAPSASPSFDSPEVERRIDRGDIVTLKQVNISTILDRIRQYLDNVHRDISNSSSDSGRRTIQTDAINHLRDIDEFFRCIDERLGDQIFVRDAKRSASSIPELSFQEVDPDAILSSREDMCILGSAGAGKTCLARIIAQHAIDQGLKCIYFPCAWIRTDADTLNSAIAAFLVSLTKEASTLDSRSLLGGLDLLILDGCDEARSFGGTLAADLRGFSDEPTLSVQVQEACGDQPFIPEDLSEDVSWQSEGKAYRIRANSRISQSDYSRLISSNAGTPFRAGLEQLAKKSKDARPRILLTTRTASDLDLPNTFQYMELRPFDDRQLETFCTKWFEGKDSSHKELLAFLDANPHVKDICRTPLTVVFQPKWHKG